MPPEDTDSTSQQPSTQAPLQPVGINPQETLPPPQQFPPADVPQNQPPNVPPGTDGQSTQVETAEKPKKSLAAWCLAVFYLIYTFLLIYILISQVTSGSTSIISFIPQILISVFIFLSVLFYSKLLMKISYIYIGFWLIVDSLSTINFFIPQTHVIFRRIFDNAFISITFGFLGTILIDFITLAKLLHLTFAISFLTFYFIGAAVSIISLVILRLSVLSFGNAEGIKKFIPEVLILFLIIVYGTITFLGNTFNPKLFSSAPKGLMLTFEAPSPPPNSALKNTNNQTPSNPVAIITSGKTWNDCKVLPNETDYLPQNFNEYTEDETGKGFQGTNVSYFRPPKGDSSGITRQPDLFSASVLKYTPDKEQEIKNFYTQISDNLLPEKVGKDNGGEILVDYKKINMQGYPSVVFSAKSLNAAQGSPSTISYIYSIIDEHKMLVTIGRSDNSIPNVEENYKNWFEAVCQPK